MQIIKRNGTTESYDREKIAVAIRKSFISTQKEITDEAVYTIVDEVEQFLHQNEANRSVERIQDEVERSLMEHGFYAEAKNYILYRWQRTERRKDVYKRQISDSHYKPTGLCVPNQPLLPKKTDKVYRISPHAGCNGSN